MPQLQTVTTPASKIDTRLEELILFYGSAWITLIRDHAMHLIARRPNSGRCIISLLVNPVSRDDDKSQELGIRQDQLLILFYL